MRPTRDGKRLGRWRRRLNSGGGRCGSALGLEQRLELPRLDARHEVLVGVDPLGQHRGIAPAEGTIQAEELLRHARGHLRQHRREQHREQLEPVQRA